MLVQPLSAHDLAAALAIQAEAYPAFLREDGPAFASRLTMDASYCLAAIDDGILVAYLLAHGWPSRSPPPIGAILPASAASEILYLHDLAVSAVGRGAGIGRALVRRAFALAAGDGLAAAELIAVEGAAPYWASLGFQPIATSPALATKIAAYGPDACLMQRALAAPPL